jgi:hypothetical protein
MPYHLCSKYLLNTIAETNVLEAQSSRYKEYFSNSIKKVNMVYFQVSQKVMNYSNLTDSKNYKYVINLISDEHGEIERHKVMITTFSFDMLCLSQL